MTIEVLVSGQPSPRSGYGAETARKTMKVISEELGSAMEWKPEDRFRSNRGKGPLVARIFGETPKCLEMELWNERHKSPIRRKFRLSARFLASSNCRWKKVRKDNLREIQRSDRKKESEWRQADDAGQQP